MDKVVEKIDFSTRGSEKDIGKANFSFQSLSTERISRKDFDRLAIARCLIHEGDEKFIINFDIAIAKKKKNQRAPTCCNTPCGRFGLMSKFFGSSQVLYRGMRTRLSKIPHGACSFPLGAMAE